MIIGVVGGSGLYQLSDESREEIKVTTPYGEPSGSYIKEHVGEHTLYFLPRHGSGHRILPSEINYRANIYGFKHLKCEVLMSVSAVGSLRKEIEPGHFVLPTQYLDRTSGVRASTFFGNGVVAHAYFADPACASTRAHLEKLMKDVGITVHVGGTYVCMEGPQFSTRAESHWYRSMNIPGHPMSVIGMTAIPEAKLAREAGLCYQTVAMATDYDCWNEHAGDVSIEKILEVLAKNVSKSRQVISEVSKRSFPACRSGCREIMKNAVVTPKELWPKNRREELEVILR